MVKLVMSYLRALSNQQSLSVILFRGVSTAFILQMVGILLGVSSNVAIARWGGVTNYGTYTYVFSWVTLLVFPVLLGLDKGAIRFIAQYRAQRRWSTLRGYVVRSLQLVFFNGIIVGGILFLVVWFFMDRFSKDLGRALMYGSALVPVYAIITLRQRTFQGLRHIAMSKLPASVIIPIFFTLGCGLLFYFTGSTVTGSNIVLIFTGICICTLVAFEIVLWKSIPRQVLDIKPSYSTSEWIYTSLPLMLFSGLLIVTTRIDIIMLGAIVGTEEVGVYGAANKIVRLVLFGLTAGNAITAPLISELHAAGRFDDLQKAVRKSVRLGCALSTPLILIVILGGQNVLGLFGQEFVSGTPILYIQLVGQLVSVFVGPAGFLLTMTGYQNEAAKYLALAVVVNFVLNMILIPAWGMVGAATATSISIAAHNIILANRARKLVGIKSTLF